MGSFRIRCARNLALKKIRPNHEKRFHLPGIIPGFACAFAALLISHWPLLSLPYYWDEAGYYVPAALDFLRRGVLIPQTTLPTGHTPALTLYLAFVWKIFGFTPVVTRTAMLMIASGTLVALWKLARRAVGREAAFWAVALLAVSPLFFAQSSLVQIDLPAALFTTLSLAALLDRRWAAFAVAASLAVLSKETAVVILPVAWMFAWRRCSEKSRTVWLWVAAPIVPLVLWSLYFHHATGYWTGNSGYLQYNLYTTVEPLHIMTALLRRVYQVFIGGFNWMLVLAAIVARLVRAKSSGMASDDAIRRRADLRFLATALVATYIAMLSFVGGAVLPRYLLPAFPIFYLVLVIGVARMGKRASRAVFLMTGALFIAAWFINPPYPFPYEDNLAYADFIRLHQQAARFLSNQAGRPRILSAWPATDELDHPDLGYVKHALREKGIRAFTAPDFDSVRPGSFDLLYLYSRKWEPRHNWMVDALCCRQFILKALGYEPTAEPDAVAAHFKLRLLRSWSRRGQWVRIYGK